MPHYVLLLKFYFRFIFVIPANHKAKQTHWGTRQLCVVIFETLGHFARHRLGVQPLELGFGVSWVTLLKLYFTGVLRSWAARLTKKLRGDNYRLYNECQTSKFFHILFEYIKLNWGREYPYSHHVDW